MTESSLDVAMCRLTSITPLIEVMKNLKGEELYDAKELLLPILNSIKKDIQDIKKESNSKKILLQSLEILHDSIAKPKSNLKAKIILTFLISVAFFMGIFIGGNEVIMLNIQQSLQEYFQE